jgi:hypothetical protein
MRGVVDVSDEEKKSSLREGDKVFIPIEVIGEPISATAASFVIVDFASPFLRQFLDVPHGVKGR